MEDMNEIQEIIEEAHIAGDIKREYSLQSWFGYMLFSEKDFSQASELYQGALKIAEETHDLTAKGMTLSNLGSVYVKLGNVEEAKRLYEEALQVAREIGNRTVEGSALNNLGLVAYSRGDTETAKRLFDESLGIAQETYNYTLKSDVLNNLSLLPREPEEIPDLDLPYETKKHRSLLTASLVLTSLTGILFVVIWILHAFSLISLVWINTLCVLGVLIGMLGALFGLAAQQQGLARLRLNSKSTE